MSNNKTNERHIRYLAEYLLSSDLNSLNERETAHLMRISKRLQGLPTGQQPLTSSESLTFGERLADRVAELGGSWGFIILFCVFLFAWSVINSFILGKHAFDPYPYIFLNLMLSMLAAIQAPIIMMSQNRQASRDRMTMLRDFDVNLKAENAIAELHKRIDHLTWQTLSGFDELKQLQKANTPQETNTKTQ